MEGSCCLSTEVFHEVVGGCYITKYCCFLMPVLTRHVC